MKIKIVIIVLSFFILTACTSDTIKSDTNDISAEELSLRITALNTKIVGLEEQVNSLTELVNQSEQIYPVDIDGRLLYVNSVMPFAVSIDNKDDLPLVVYGKNGTLSIYYMSGEVTQFIEAYSIIPVVLTKENNVEPEFYDKDQIIKAIDNNWVIVRVNSVETSLDESTNIKINVMLENIKFY